MYSRPSTEVIVAPCALRKKTGAPPTLLNARTGLCTPPGVMRWARSKYSRDRSCESKAVCSEAILRSCSLSLWERVRVRVLASRNIPSPEPSPKGRGSPLSPYPQFLRITRDVRNDVLGAGAFEYVPGLAQSFFELYQALLSQQHQAGIFSAHLIGADLPSGLLMNRANQIQRSQARLDHQQVRAFLRTTTARVNCVCAIAHIELVMTAIAE